MLKYHNSYCEGTLIEVYVNFGLSLIIIILPLLVYFKIKIIVKENIEAIELSTLLANFCKVQGAVRIFISIDIIALLEHSHIIYK